MNYLTEYYKNLSERLQSQINSLQKQLNEAEGLYGARPLRWGRVSPGDEEEFNRNRPPFTENNYPEWQWYHNIPGIERKPTQVPQPGVRMPGSQQPAVRPLDPTWTSPLGGPQYKPGFPGGQRRPQPGQNDTIPDIFQQPTHEVPGISPDVHGPPSPTYAVPGQQRSSSSSSSYY